MRKVKRKQLTVEQINGHVAKPYPLIVKIPEPLSFTFAEMK